MANKWQIRMNSFNQRNVDRFVEEKAENILDQFPPQIFKNVLNRPLVYSSQIVCRRRDRYCEENYIRKRCNSIIAQKLLQSGFAQNINKHK